MTSEPITAAHVFSIVHGDDEYLWEDCTPERPGRRTQIDDRGDNRRTPPPEQPMSDTEAGPLDLYTEMKAIDDATGDADKLGRARDLIRQVAALPAADQQAWRDAIRQVVPKITKGDFDAIVREERKALKEKAKEEARQAAIRQAAERREAAAAAGELLPSPADPMAVARVLVDRIPATDGVPHTSWWRGDFYQWTGSRWVMQPDEDIVTRWLYLQTEHAVYDAGEEYKRWAPTSAKIANLIEAIGSAVLARPWDEDDVRCTAVQNGVLDTRTRKLLPHSPKRFNLTSLSFAYDPEAACPKWLKFLNEVLPDDQEAREFLQEWFGYVLSGRTDLQKMADLYGAKRSGKGTIARILEALLGPEAVTAPSLSSLTGTFGEQPLIGKALVMLSDVNWSIREIGEAVEILKKISGEDSRTVHRKNHTAWHGQLGVRFLVVGNEAPKFNDPSGALAGRMIHVKFTVSFFNKEDPTLTAQLMEELPGIFNWALDGIDRLTKRGRFKEPASSKEAEKEVLRLTSPVWGFIQDRCEMNPDPNAVGVLLDELYLVYKEWAAAEEGRDRVSTKAIFSRDLRSAGNGAIIIRREGAREDRRQWVYGLTPAYEDAFKVKIRWAGDSQ